ncbi:GreA/GreB family elongation factor [Bordetella sp. 2513F-2]
MQASTPERMLTELDHTRLASLLARMTAAGLPAGAADTAIDLLDSAQTVPARSIAADVVTMRTRLRLRHAGGSELDIALSYPAEADAGSGRISVLSPLGLSLIGRRAGQAVQWQGPDRVVHQATVEQILYQPEAAGDYGS